MTSEQAPIQPAGITGQRNGGQSPSARRVRIICWVGALILGLVQVWARRHVVNDGDGMSYLDLAHAFQRGDWSAALNAYWSPFYPWVLGTVFRIVKPSISWDITLAHFVNFGIYVAALASFDFFWRALYRSQRNAGSSSTSEGIICLPEWAWLALGYALFAWTSLQLIHLLLINPDLCVATFVYLAAGLMVRIRMNPGAWWTYWALGVVLGFGYFAKAAMFPMAFIFLVASALAAGKLRIGLPRVGVSFLVFLMLALPLVFGLSRDKGRLTFGDSGKLAYACFLYGIGGADWQGQPPGTGTPKHPPRKVLDQPPIYDFTAHLRGTYPPSFDPSYWEDGMGARFNLRGQARILRTSMIEYFKLFVLEQGGLITAALILLFLCGIGRSCTQIISGYGYLLIPALAAMGMFALVLVDGRYIAADIVLFWAAIFSGIRLPASRESKGIATAIIIVVLAMLGVQIAARIANDIGIGTSEQAKVPWEVAWDLRRLGVEPGDKVASAGDTYNAHWAHLAEVTIVAETPDYSRENFWWAADPQVRAQVFQTFAKSGAKVLVADRPPIPDWSADWQRIGNTQFYAHFLTPLEASPPARGGAEKAVQAPATGP